MSLYRMVVADVMTFDPIVVRSDEPIEVARDLMESNHISGLPVVDERGGLLGVVSQTDLLALAEPPLATILHGRRNGLRVGEVMSSPALTVAMTDSLVDAAKLMEQESVHRLVALDDDQQPVGVLSASDYVALVAEG